MKGKKSHRKLELAHAAAASFIGSPKPCAVVPACSHPVRVPCFIRDLSLEDDLRRKEVPDVSHVQYSFKCYSYLIKDQTEWKGNSFSFNLYIESFFPLLAAVIYTASLERYHLI